MRQQNRTRDWHMHIKVQILDEQKGLNKGYLRYEYLRRHLHQHEYPDYSDDEDVEMEGNGLPRVILPRNRLIVYCDQAKINGVRIAFLAYSAFSDKDEKRLKIFHPMLGDRLQISDQ